MRIFVGLVAADERLRRHFGLGKDAIIPNESLSRGVFSGRGIKILQSAYVPETTPSITELEAFVLSRSKDADACILIVDDNLIHLASGIRNSVFIAGFDPDLIGSSLRNFFHLKLSRALKAFGQILSRFEKNNDGDLLTLPLRNFPSRELIEIARLCREENMKSDFGDLVEKQLVVLRNRLRPRRKSRYKTIYAVDDQQRFFVYGKERHAKFATGGEHRRSCEIAGQLRFGKNIDPDRHFNVSETEGDTTAISGVFLDCHDVRRTVGPRPHISHLNMFPNDYF